MTDWRPRRLVTGDDGRGRSFAVLDGVSTGHFVFPEARFDVVWRVNEQPPRVGNSVEPDNLSRYWMRPPPGMTTWVVHEVSPEGSAAGPDSASPQAVESSLQRFDDGGVYEGEGRGWHRTNTLDFVIVLEGQIDLELDDGVHRLGPGDCVVQTGTRHRWVNRGDKPCRISGVVIGARNQEVTEAKED